MPDRFGAASSSRRAKPDSKSRAIPKPVKTPPNAADWIRTKQNWNAVYQGGKSNPGTFSTCDSPPAKAVKKKSGKISEGKKSAGFVKTFLSVRHATPAATGQILMSARADP